MSVLQLQDLQKAWETHDPNFFQSFQQLLSQPDPVPETPAREAVPRFEDWLSYIKSPEFRRKSQDEQRQLRREKLLALESPNAEVPLPDRLKSHQVIDAIWRSNSPLARDYLLRVIAEVPLVYGPWKAIKRIYKEAEAKQDTVILGAIAARIDMALAGHGQSNVSKATLQYMARRSWRFLRRVGLSFPAVYADVAVDFLIPYQDSFSVYSSWVLRNIFNYDAFQKRSGLRITYWDENAKDAGLKSRGFNELWKRSPRPLLTLLERAHSDRVRRFAAFGLRTDFRAVLREVEVEWIVRLVTVPSAAVHELIIWILQNVPKFEQGSFRKLGLHEMVLLLLRSPSSVARKYAAEYVRTHARDIDADLLIELAAQDDVILQKLAQDFISARDPRREIGLNRWAKLLQSLASFEFAQKAILQHFNAKELTPDWFETLLLSDYSLSVRFAEQNLVKIHDINQLGISFFMTLLRKIENRHSRKVVRFALNELQKLDLNRIPEEDLRWLSVNPMTAQSVDDWLRRDLFIPQKLGMDFLKALAFQPDWDNLPYLAELRAQFAWANALEFDTRRRDLLLAKMSDVRNFRNDELGLDWLLQVAAGPEHEYQQFARDRIIRSFTPSEFAIQSVAPASSVAATPTTIDLQKATFLFTGKLATMTRDVAEGQVKAANGTVSGSVNKNLHYLVIGDEGSPLYGQGAKGSKQTKAEQLNDAGANIRIISETMFLQMLTGGTPQAVDSSATLAGCERLWQILLAPGPADAPLGVLAIQYILRHHPVICMEETSRPVDPGAEIPADFLTWGRVQPLLTESRKPQRELGLKLCRYEFARWNPDVEELVRLSESPYVDVRRFIAESLLAENTKESKLYRINPATLAAAAVYRFCESHEEETRGLGMEIIRRIPKLQVPEELFRLTQSPDRKVRAFVIRSLWNVYRDRGATRGWKPPENAPVGVSVKAKKAAQKREQEQGDGVPLMPEKYPANEQSLSEFLRRILFELPPGPPEKSRLSTGADDSSEVNEEAQKKPKTSLNAKVVSLKPIPARRAKIEAVETFRDLALENESFAEGILPLLREFLQSVGQSERAACLVAVTRIHHHYPNLK